MRGLHARSSSFAALPRLATPRLALPHHDARAPRFAELCLGAELTYLLLLGKIIARVIFYQGFPVFLDHGLLLT
jgi:hypothetical protein